MQPASPCLTLFSEPTRHQLQIAACKPPKPRRTKTPSNWRMDQAFGLRLTLLSEPTLAPNCSFQASKTLVSPHTETPCNWRTDQAFGLRLPLPNNAFWTEKKLAPNCSLQASETLALTHRDTMQLKDGQALHLVAACAKNGGFAALRHIQTTCYWRTDQVRSRGAKCLTLLSDATLLALLVLAPRPAPLLSAGAGGFFLFSFVAEIASLTRSSCCRQGAGVGRGRRIVYMIWYDMTWYDMIWYKYRYIIIFTYIYTHIIIYIYICS